MEVVVGCIAEISFIPEPKEAMDLGWRLMQLRLCSVKAERASRVTMGISGEQAGLEPGEQMVSG